MDKGAGVARTMRLLGVMIGLAPLLWVPLSQGQTTSITSSGLNTQVSHVGGQPSYDITGGTRPGNGTNLFHSFGDFSVGTHDVARFMNDAHLPTTNILSRVTGGNPSNIFGEINTTNFPGANLYLINPAGVLFGATATLNVSGSAHVSTADYLRLADGLRFKAIPGPQDALLSQAPVVAFGFLTAHPRPITAQGSRLSVEEGKVLSLVGGEIKVTGGTLAASGGQINLVSLAGRGEARIAPEGITISKNTHRGHIVIKGGTQPDDVARIDTSGLEGGAVVIRGGKLSLARVEVTTEATEADQTGGAIVIEATKSATLDRTALRTGEQLFPNIPINLGGGSVLLTAPSVRASNLTIDTTGFDGGLAGDVTINVRNLTATNSRIHSESNLLGDVSRPGGGNISIRASGDVTLHGDLIRTDSRDRDAGHITVRAATLTMTEGGAIASVSDGDGRSGDIVIDVGRLIMHGPSDTHSFTRPGIASNSFHNSAPGGGGDISVSARKAIIIDGGVISTTEVGPGDGGSITLSTPHLTLDHSGDIVTELDGARAGDISVNVRTLNMFNGGHIVIASPGYGGSPGDINITASQSISMAGMGTGIGGPIPIMSSVSGKVHLVTPTLHLDKGATVFSGQAGHIVLDVDHLSVQREARIESTGQGGTIVINAAKDIALDHGTLTATVPDFAGQAGNVHLHAGKSILVQNGSLISADAGTGEIGSLFNAGNIVIQSGRSVVIRDSSVSARAPQGNGGTITVDAKNVALKDSQLTTSVSGGPETVGGRISVDAKNVTLRNSQILSTATEGQGGTINIRSHALHRDTRSVVDASSEFGTDGTVIIESGH